MMKSHRRGFTAFSVFLLPVVLSAFFYGSGDREFARVTAVYDGDTIGVRLSGGKYEKVRLIGIDSPEMDDPREAIRLQACLSKRFAYICLHGREVELVYDWERRDVYGRLLAFIMTPEGLFNRIILERGFSSVYLKYPFREDYRETMGRAYREAREYRRGLWKDDPYPDILPELAWEHLGSLSRVLFRCDSVRMTSRLILLSSSERNFSVIVQQENAFRFPGLNELKGKMIRVSGLIEEYRGRPQMILFSPQQLETGFVR